MPNLGQSIILSVEVDCSASLAYFGAAFEGCAKAIRMASGLGRMTFEEIAKCIVGILFFPRKLRVIVDLRIVRSRIEAGLAARMTYFFVDFQNV
jgi:hypothetical protein